MHRFACVLTAFKLDRQFVLVWGSYKDDGKSRFTADELSEGFAEKVTTLPRSMEACSTENFPFVVCCDPSGDSLPDFVRGNLRGAKSKSYGNGQFVAVANARFMNFDVLLKEGRKLKGQNADICGVNMDRQWDDPNTG